MENHLDKIPTLPLTFHEKFSLCTLCYINLLNYLDRYSVPAVLADIQKEYNIGNDRGALLKTAFIVPYTISALVFGFLGDRYTRRALLTFCVLFRHTMALCGTMSSNYTLFLVARAFAGIAESGFAVVAPVVLSDIVFSRTRSLWIAVFTVAVPTGCGLGFIIASEISKMTGMWWWGLRTAPICAMFGTLLLWFSRYPERGEKEAAALGGKPVQSTGFGQDICYLLHLPTFICTCVGSAGVSFIVGAIVWWMPKFLYLAFNVYNAESHVEYADIAMHLGLITLTASIIGVIIAVLISQCCRYNFEFIDPVLIGIALLLGAPFLLSALYVASTNMIITYVFYFLAIVFVNVHWVLSMDMMMYTIIPPRRCTGLALQLLFFHAFGDAISPYFVGKASEGLKDSSIFPEEHSELVKYKSFKMALLSTILALLVGAIAYLIDGCFIIKDWTKAQKQTVEEEKK